MKNLVETLIVGAVACSAIFGAISTVNYLNESYYEPMIEAQVQELQRQIRVELYKAKHATNYMDAYAAIDRAHRLHEASGQPISDYHLKVAKEVLN